MNIEQTALQLEKWIRDSVQRVLKKQGIVVGLDGDVHAGVVAALSSRALGPNRVLGLAMPEKGSSPDRLVYVRRLALHLRIDLIVEDLTAALQGLGAYEEDDGSDQPALSLAGYPLAQPSGSATANTLRLQPCTSAEVQERITTARQLKQRMRLSTLSYFAERRNYAVLGCASGQGMQLAFLVKYGQTDSNLMPIAQLGSEQLEQLAEYLRVPAEQRRQQPAADSVSVMPAQEAFFPPACFSSGSPMAVYGKGSGRRSCRGSTMP